MVNKADIMTITFSTSHVWDGTEIKKCRRNREKKFHPILITEVKSEIYSYIHQYILLRKNNVIYTY